MALDLALESQRILSESPYAVLQPTPALYNGFLQLAKSLLDPLANDVTNAQSERQQALRSNRKRKRKSTKIFEEKEEPLKMRKVYVEGFDVDQVWQQAKRVLNAAVSEVERELLEENEDSSEAGGQLVKNGGGEADSDEYDEDILEAGNSEDAMDIDGEDVEDDDQEEDLEDDFDSEDKLEEGDGGLFDGEDVLDEDDSPPSEISEDPNQQEVLVKDKFGLNDGFFSIDDFNKQTQFLENQDVRGDPDDGAASDEEDVDWAIDPLSIGASNMPSSKNQTSRTAKTGKKPAKKHQIEDENEDEEEEDDDEEDGPTFGDVDLFAPDGASEDDQEMEEGDDMLGGDFANTNSILYADFFAPPAKKKGKKKNDRADWLQTLQPRTNNANSAPENDSELDLDLKNTMSAVHRDLFDDHLFATSQPDDPTAAPRSKLSTHELAQQALRAEIRKLEAANVAAKPWYLSGEAVAATRPINSLLEEELDFERAGKPVPVITEEVNESIEQLIKRRILAQEFDEVIRRRPTDLVTGGAARGRVREELADTKPTKGLAEEYEQEHLRRTDPNFVDTRTEALKVAHREIELQWAKVSAQLDALSNWHYKPKPAVASLEVRVNAPIVSLEDARPSAGGDVGGASTLAPQELYRAGEGGAGEGEVLTKGGMSVAKEEETREQKKRRRAREKQKMKKQTGAQSVAEVGKDGKGAVKGKKAEREEVVSQLKKGGVKIIDRKGGLKDVEGKAVKETIATTGGAAYRL